MVSTRDQNAGRSGNGTGGADPAAGHNRLVAQPHTEAEGPIADAEAVAARISTEQHPLGPLGRPLNSRSPFFVGMSAAAGVAVTIGVIEMIITVGDVLVLVGVALFVAIGLEPAVSFLARHRFPRWAAVLTVLVVGLAVVGGFLAAAVPPLAAQATQFVTHAPTMVPRVLNHNRLLGQLNVRFHLQQRVQQTALSG